MSGITYDAGALLAAESDDRALLVLHRRALARGIRPLVPAAVLAQAWRGGPQASLSRLLRGCQVEAMTEERARAAGLACARSRTADVVDAVLVIGAIGREDVVVTRDPGDLQCIAAALGRRLTCHRV